MLADASRDTREGTRTGFLQRVIDRDADQRGVVVVWLAVMIVLFLGVAAFAIDVAYWHLVQGR